MGIFTMKVGPSGENRYREMLYVTASAREGNCLGLEGDSAEGGNLLCWGEPRSLDEAALF